MTTQTFIEKAIEGGWGKDFFYRGEITSCKKEAGKIYLEWYSGETESLHLYEESKECVLLDPSAWQAVGKVEGWKKNGFDLEGMARGGVPTTKYHNVPEWKMNMRRMIDALAEGKTIEQYLKTL